MSEVTAFESAITAGDLAKVTQALDGGQDVNERLSSGRMACHEAAMKGHKEVLQLLIDREADLEVTDKDGRTPCHLAASAGHKEVLQLLLDKKANIEVTDKKGHSPCHLAVLGGRKDAVQLLLDRGADFRCPDAAGVTWLVRALSTGGPAQGQQARQTVDAMCAHLRAFAAGATSRSKADQWRGLKAWIEVTVDMFE